jgi:thiol-disulfide isomerase/thioredoxin
MRNGLFLQATFLACASIACAAFWAWNSARAAPQPNDKPSAPVETLPASRGGQDLVGTKLPELHFDRWLNTPGNHPIDTSNSITLYRWWTDTCPYCAATLPAIEKLRGKYGAEGLKIVAVYHPKPPRAVKDADVSAAADRIGYRGAIAIDADWSQLRKVYLSPGRRGATSVSFVVDRAGVIRFVHPGVEFFPSDQPDQAQQNEDFRLIDKAIATLLAEKH